MIVGGNVGGGVRSIDEIFVGKVCVVVGGGIDSVVFIVDTND